MVEDETGGKPFVSIGVTTYNRHDLLCQTLHSILAQTYTNFEVIVGNDYTEETLTGELIGITDPRIRFVNHPQNLREVGNMNKLLELAQGHYFTWLFDDDLYEPDFLQTAHDCLVEKGLPPAFFPSFRMILPGEKFKPKSISRRPITELTGPEFLRMYSPRRPKIVSTCGLFKTSALKETIGGVEELSPSAIGVYCEYLLLVRCALLDRIIFMDAPFVIFRIHSSCWSENPMELDKYLSAGKELILRSALILRHPTLFPDFDANLRMICEQHLVTVAHRFAKINITRKQFGIGTCFQTILKYRQEANQTLKAFYDQGGKTGFRVKLAFANIDVYCYYIILMNLASGFYRRK